MVLKRRSRSSSSYLLSVPLLRMKLSHHSRKKRQEKVDHLSNLPDVLLLTILSLLPIKDAARTSVLSSRFCNLWTACPNLQLSHKDFPHIRQFVDVTTRCLCLRQLNPEAKLLNFFLNSRGPDCDLPEYLISWWLKRAHSLGVRELSVYFDCSGSLLPLTFSLPSIQSLVFHTRFVETNVTEPIAPFLILLTHLKSLHLRVDMHHSDLTRLVNAQGDLEYLCLENVNVQKINIELEKLKVLKQTMAWVPPLEMNLNLPLLETLHITVCLHGELKHFKGKMTLLKKATIIIPNLSEKSVPVLGQILRSIANVEELNLYIKKLFIISGIRSFHPLVEQGKELPAFPNLRKLKVAILFHQKSIQDVVSLLHHTPVLESLKLVHVNQFCWRGEDAWVSKLPRDAQSNRDRAYFSDLLKNENKKALIEFLINS